ncbi:MAG: ATP-binding protein [Myxococcota bacterium]|jgi:two-component system sensor histidine kinase RegB
MRTLTSRRLEAPDINFAWLVRLRWLVWLGLVGLTAWATWGLGIRVHVGWVLAMPALGLVSNAAAWAWHRRAHATEGSLLALMLTDTALTTLYFFLTGGPFNPFTTLYLVNIVLGTLVLSRTRQWVQVGASLLGFASLFWLERLAPDSLELPNHAQLMRLHLTGMLLAFAAAAAFIVTFMQRVQSALKARDVELESARKLAALTTLAAGAAHELATPLGTIAVVSKELERALAKVTLPDGALDDVRLVRAQVDRCRDILQGMSVSSGELAGEPVTRFSAAAWLGDALKDVKGAERVALPEQARLDGVEVEGPRAALAQALKNLVKNALEATPGDGRVTVAFRSDGDALTLAVSDQGPGIPAEVLSRVGEPFFTTKEPGRGMGLGVFLARTLAEQLGGRLSFESREGAGTTAHFTVPRRMEERDDG